MAVRVRGLDPVLRCRAAEGRVHEILFAGSALFDLLLLRKPFTEDWSSATSPPDPQMSAPDGEYTQNGPNPFFPAYQTYAQTRTLDALATRFRSPLPTAN